MYLSRKNTHGGDVWGKKPLLDFSANVNPYGMPERVKRAVASSAGDCTLYPDPHCTELREGLSAYENLPADMILCGNGAAELIYSFAFALPKEKEALIVTPTFGEYAEALRAAGIRFRFHPLREEEGFVLSEDIFASMDGTLGAVFLCSPNNPTGITVDFGLLCRIADRCREAGARLFSDFCFLDLSSGAGYDVSRLVRENPFVFALKAFTKGWGMAGVRLGYALCSDEAFLEEVSEKAPCWNVSLPAQRAGIAALEEPGWVKDCALRTVRERERMRARLQKSGVTVYAGEANYLLLKSPLPLHKLLLHRGILTRDCGDFQGLDGSYLRVAVRKPEENEILLQTIEEIIKDGLK